MEQHLRTLVPLIVAVIATTAIAGCGSGAHTPLLNNPAATGSQASVNPNADRCDNRGGLRVSPCHIVFDSTNPGPTNVTVRHTGRIGERDNCATAGVATIVRTGRNTFMVTAGATNGSCTAHFRFVDDNGTIEKGTLTVDNRL